MATDNKRTVHVFRTAYAAEDRLSHAGRVTLSLESETAPFPTIEIDCSHTYQKIEGFGGAFTEAAAYALSKMSAGKRQEALRACFDPDAGLGYSLCRTHINSCDFSLDNYSYAEIADDRHLDHFSIDRDTSLLIPMIKDAMAVPGSDFRVFASPWSPPAWMKTNGEMNHGGKLKPEYLDTWALYFAKYIKAYAAQGIPIWAVTVQNEPVAVQTWDSCIWSGEEERDFVRDHLGPRLAAEGLGEVKIMVWDHNKDLIVERAKAVLDDHEAARYVWGIAFHWYTGDHFDSLAKVHELFPDKKLLFSEGCQEHGVKLGSWSLGERYGHELIGDLNNWSVGFVDWNMVLDERGGPNHAGNFCDAPIIADSSTDTLHYQSSYFYLGHFSKFIRPGAVRIGCTITGTEMEATACRNPDGSTAVVVMNAYEKETPFALKTESGSATITAPPRSMLTLVY